MRPSHSASSPPKNIQSNVKSQQISECSRSQNEKSKSWEEAGYIPISPMSDEVTEVQLTLPYGDGTDEKGMSEYPHV